MIKVKYTPNQESRSETFNYSDFGLSREEWMALSDDEKRNMLNDGVEHEPPYWTVDSFTEEPEGSAEAMDKCQSCGCAVIGSSPCPFVEEIHDEESMCNCCDECRYECAQNI